MVGYIYLIKYNQITSSSREKFALKIFWLKNLYNKTVFLVYCARLPTLSLLFPPPHPVVIMHLSLRRSLRSPGFSSFSSFPSRSPLTRSFTFHFSWRERMEPRVSRIGIFASVTSRARSLSFCAYFYSLIHYHRAAWMCCINEMEITS